MKKAILTIRIWNNDGKELPGDDLGELSERMPPHLDHVSQLCGDGYTSGEIVDEDFRGWWEIKEDEEA